MERPANPYVLQRTNRWLVCDDPNGPQGFGILVRQYITNAERDDLNEVVREVVKYNVEYLEAPLDAREALEQARGGSPRDMERRMLAPYIVDWNAAGEDDKGNIVPIPAPADGGPDVFHLITKEQYDWCYEMVISGYQATGKAGKSKGE